MITSAKKLLNKAPKGYILFASKVANVYKVHICSASGIKVELLSPGLYKKLWEHGALSNSGLERISNIKLEEIAGK